MKNRTEDRLAKHVRCDGCGKLVPIYDTITRLSERKHPRDLCSRCSNTETARLDGLDKFQHVTFEPVRLTDCTGKVHEFHFRVHLFGPGVSLDSFELRNGGRAGYQFQVIGEPEDDLLVLLGKLIEKMRRALSIQHVVKGELGLQIADDQDVRGTIGWDEDEDGRVPLLVVDGREITWEEFGRMLMTYEGWQFKLQIRDKSDEV